MKFNGKVKKDDDRIIFEKIKGGDTFYLNGFYWIKLFDNDGLILNLETGKTDMIYDAKVLPVELEVTAINIKKEEK